MITLKENRKSRWIIAVLAMYALAGLISPRSTSIMNWFTAFEWGSQAAAAEAKPETQPGSLSKDVARESAPGSQSVSTDPHPKHGPEASAYPKATRSEVDAFVQAIGTLRGQKAISATSTLDSWRRNDSISKKEYLDILFRVYEQLKQTGEYSFEVMWYLSEELQRKGDREAALQIFQDAIKAIEDEKPFLDALGGVSLNSPGTKAAAIAQLKKIIAFVKDNPDKTYSQCQLNQYPKHAERSHRGISRNRQYQDPSVAAVAQNAVDAYDKNDYSEAERLFESIGDRESAAACLAICAWEESIKTKVPNLDAVITKYPETIAACAELLYKGKYYREAGETEKALEAFQGVLEKCPHIHDSIDACWELGIMYLKKKDKGKAIIYFERAYEIGYNSTPKYINHYHVDASAVIRWTQQDIAGCRALYERLMTDILAADENAVVADYPSRLKQVAYAEGLRAYLDEGDFSDLAIRPRFMGLPPID